jgi:hypothetical protein
VTFASKRELQQTFARRYKAARSAADKGKLLDEFCELSGYHRKYAITLLRKGPIQPKQRPARKRERRYDAAAEKALVRIWEAADYPWSVRLKAMLPLWLPWAGVHLKFSSETERELRTMSPRTMDRMLRAHKQEIKRRRFGRTKPGTLLKHHIPIKTDSWDVNEPGFTEIDSVAHCGNTAYGEFINSVNMTDIHTTWTETRAVLGKSEQRVGAVIEEMRGYLPFPLRGLDSDNGSEFINQHLYRYCVKNNIQFTRGRPYKKNDNAHIEQKNWTHVRKILGWARFDTIEVLEAINDLYCNELRLWMNFFQPTVKLIKKERIGSRLLRHYSLPRTPLDRVLDEPNIDAKTKEILLAQRETLDPFVLAAKIEEKLERIRALAAAQQVPKLKKPGGFHGVNFRAPAPDIYIPPTTSSG